MANTTNFGWETPDDTDLVKDGAAAMRTLGSAIDTSLVDLKGGTTGQVLAKASNTDMDFTWSSVDPLTILDAKGDLISATAADTPARLAVGANGTVLTADSSEATGLKWATPATTKSFSLLGTATLSSTTTTISGLSGYDDFLITIDGAQLTSGNGALIWRLNSNTNSVYSQAGLRYLNGAAYATNLGGQAGAFGDDRFEAGKANSTTGGSVRAALSIRGANTSGIKIVAGNSGLTDAGGSGGDVRSWQGLFDSTSVISSVSFTTLASTFSAGTMKVYGAV